MEDKDEKIATCENSMIFIYRKEDGEKATMLNLARSLFSIDDREMKMRHVKNSMIYILPLFTTKQNLKT